MSQVDTALTDVALVVTQQNKQLAPKIDAWCRRSAEATDLAKLVPQELETDANESDAVDACKIAADLRKEIDTARKVIVQPFNGLVRVINGTLGSIIQECRTVESDLKGRVLELRRKREKERLAAEEEARKEAPAAKSEDATPTAPAEASPPASTRGSGMNPGTMTARKIMRFRITDFAKVPDAYKIIDEPMLRMAAKKSPLPEIPGVEWYEDEVMAIR